MLECAALKQVQKFLFSVTFLFLFGTQLKAQYGYFYTGKPYGSELYLSPATQIMNGGFDMVQTVNYSNRFQEMDLISGMGRTFQSLIHPIEAIKVVGFKKFVDSELIPFGFSETNSQWIPNYSLHLIGGGMEYARMTDYFSHHNFQNPRLWAAVTSLTEQFLNESVEMVGKKKLSYSAVSDFYFFDIPGIILFSFEPVQRFFSEKIVLRSWLGQASFIPQDLSLRNTGQYYSVKLQPRIAKPVSLLFYMGAGWLFGGGIDIKGNTYSLAYGTKTEKTFIIDEDTEQEYVKFTPSAGFFIDRKNSLLFSLVVQTHSVYQENIRLDLFPGILKMGNKTLGLWANYSFDSRSYFGITFRGLPGIGL
ncbi:MAG: hypothetical protein ABJK11_14050 [Balneola sp.]